VNEFQKRGWLFPAIVLISLILVAMVTLLGREAIICASLGDWGAARTYGVSGAVFVVLVGFFWWGHATVSSQQLDEHGVTVLTLRGARVVLPWSAIRRAKFAGATALLETEAVRARIGFAMYRDYRAAEMFTRTRLAEVGAQVEG